MSMRWISVQNSNPYGEWPTTFAEPGAPPGMASLGAFFFLSGQFRRTSPGMFGVDILIAGSVHGTAWAYVDATGGYQLFNEVLVPVSQLAPSYEVRLQPQPGSSAFGQLTPECRMSGTLVTLFGSPGAGQIRTANARASSTAPIEAQVAISQGGPALDAFLMISGQVKHTQSAPGEAVLQVQSASGGGLSQGYAPVAGLTPMAPFLLAASQLAAAGQYDVQFSTSAPSVVGADSCQTASVVELEQPDR